MIRHIVQCLTLLAFLAVTLVADAADARTLKVRPDGSVRFNASMDGPTRISVKGDRIAKIVQTDSQFEMSNDGDTGDVFLRFVGSDAVKEAGYIITESGHTISFTLSPQSGVGSQTVLIELVGLPKTPAETEAVSADTDDGFEVDSSGTGSGHANDLVGFTRAAFNARVGVKGAGSVKSKGVYKTYSKGGLKATIRSVSVANGFPTPQAFFTRRTLGIFIDDLPDAGRVWVIVVEGK